MAHADRGAALARLGREVVACRLCPRLRAYCGAVARGKKRQFREDDYWGRPVPGFGDPRARVLVVGLAPAAHGANRTGRMFTGDGTDGAGSSDFLARALYRTGFASQPTSRARDDGFSLAGLYLTATARCAPPDNKPSPEEVRNCARFLEREMALLTDVRVIVALGKLAFDRILRMVPPSPASWNAHTRPSPPRGGEGRVRGCTGRFAHGARVDLPDGRVLLGSYHPSRQNTQTGRLTPAMFESVFRRARRLAGC